MMKQFRFLVASLLMCVCSVAGAYDFQVDGILYNILDADLLTVETTYYPVTGVDLSRQYRIYSGYTSSRPQNATSFGSTSLGSVSAGGYSHSLWGYITYQYSGVIDIPEHVTYGGNEYTVVRVGDYTFANCCNVERVNVPATVRSVGQNAFATGSSTKYVIMKANVSLTESSLPAVNNLTVVSFPSNSALESIEDYAFYYSKAMTKIVIPASTTTIAQNALSNATLSCVFCAAKEPPAYALSTTTTLSPVLFVPKESVAKYKATAPWKYYMAIVGFSADNMYTLDDDILVENVSITPNPIYIPEGADYTIVPTITPANASNKLLTWSTSDASIATVNAEGTVTSHAQGTCTVTATTQDGSALSAIATVNVIDGSEIVLQESTPYQNSVEHEFDRVTYERTFKNNQWQPLYIPFSLSYADWSENYDVASLNMMHQYDNDKNGEYETMELEANYVTSGKLKANYPYIIRYKGTATSASPYYATFVKENATLSPSNSFTASCESLSFKYDFTGVYAPIVGGLKTLGYYCMSGGTLQQAPSDAVNLGAYRWYMKITPREAQVIKAPQQIRVRIYDENGEEVETSIMGVETATETPTIYNMQGQRVSDTSRPGIYIVNGKKLMRR